MDFQFSVWQGNVNVKCSAEHVAVANWFNCEVRLNSKLISTVLSHINQFKDTPHHSDVQIIGAEYSVFLSANEVVIKANALEIESADELEDGFHYYDSESIALCGLDDFEHFLLSYLEFMDHQ